MTDTALFSSGSLFTREYLEDGIRSSQQYAAVDADALLERLQAVLSAFPHRTHPNEATTEHDLVWPVLELLGWSHWLTQQNLSGSGRENVPDGLLFIDAAAKATANEHPEEWRRYEFGAAILESKRWGRPLDRAEGRSGSERETPSTQLLRYLRRIDDLTSGRLRWGILTNGSKWRLYYAGARSTIDDYLEIDLSRILGLEKDLLDTGVTDEDRRHWLTVFGAMFARTAFEREAPGAPSFHDRARREAAFYEEHVAKSLSNLVFTDLYPSLGKAIAAAAPRDTDLGAIRHPTLILLYRLLFILYAEDRGLLPVKDRRYDDYALRVVREDVGRRKDGGDTFSRVANPIWNRFGSLAHMIDGGDDSVGLPPYNGGLFSAAHTPLLNAISLADDIMAEAIDILSKCEGEAERQGGDVRRGRGGGGRDGGDEREFHEESGEIYLPAFRVSSGRPARTDACSAAVEARGSIAARPGTDAVLHRRAPVSGAMRSGEVGGLAELIALHPVGNAVRRRLRDRRRGGECRTTRGKKDDCHAQWDDTLHIDYLNFIDQWRNSAWPIDAAA